MGLLTEIMPGTGLEELDNPVPLSPRGPEQPFCSSSASCSETWVVFVTGEATSPQYFTPDAWGRVLGVYDGVGNSLTESAIGNRILWQGREYSWKTGLYYFRARWYDPITGRWLSNDPIGISGGLNQYVFCGDNPVNARDPLGLDVYRIDYTYTTFWAVDTPSGIRTFHYSGQSWNDAGLKSMKVFLKDQAQVLYQKNVTSVMQLFPDYPDTEQGFKDLIARQGERYVTTCSEDKAVNEAFENAAANQGNLYYNAFFNNCSSFGRRIVEANVSGSGNPVVGQHAHDIPTLTSVQLFFGLLSH